MVELFVSSILRKKEFIYCLFYVMYLIGYKVKVLKDVSRVMSTFIVAQSPTIMCAAVCSQLHTSYHRLSGLKTSLGDHLYIFFLSCTS